MSTTEAKISWLKSDRPENNNNNNNNFEKKSSNSTMAITKANHLFA